MRGLAKLSAQLASVLSTWIRAVRTTSLLAWDSPRLTRSEISVNPLLTLSSSRGSPLRRKLFMLRRFKIILLGTDFKGAKLSKGQLSTLRADLFLKPAKKVQRDNKTKKPSIRP